MRILLFGGSGLLGSELQALMGRQGTEFLAPPHREVDCRDPGQVRRCLLSYRPTAVVVAAGRVGGIAANMRRGEEFLFDNAMINLVALHEARQAGVSRVMVFGGSCMYPGGIDRPIREEDLLAGPLEPTSEGYAIGKIVAAKYAQALDRSGACRGTVCVLTNLYGDRDCFDAEEGHLVSSLIVKMHRAKEARQEVLELWGDGTPRRDLLHASDAARACLLLLEAEGSASIVNVGTGKDYTVREIAEKTAGAVGFQGRILFSGGIPNGTARKLLAVERITAMGWRPAVSLGEGLRRAYQSYLKRSEETLAERRAG